MENVIINLLETALNIYFFVLVARLVLDFAKEEARRHPISVWIHKATEPVLAPIRKYVPDQQAGSVRLDMALILLLIVYRLFLARLIIGIFSMVMI